MFYQILVFFFYYDFSYPSIYINEQFQQFFLFYLSTISSIMPIIDNEEQFIAWRKKLLSYSSVKQILADKSTDNINTIIKHHYGPGGEGAASDICIINVERKFLFIDYLKPDFKVYNDKYMRFAIVFQEHDLLRFLISNRSSK